MATEVSESMIEPWLFGDINEKYIEKAAVEEETLTVSTKETHIMKKKYIIRMYYSLVSNLLHCICIL